MTIEQAEEEQRQEAAEYGFPISPHWEKRWNDFKCSMQTGDFLWYFEWFPEPFKSAAGYCIMRGGVVIALIATKRA